MTDWRDDVMADSALSPEHRAELVELRRALLHALARLDAILRLPRTVPPRRERRRDDRHA